MLPWNTLVYSMLLFFLQCVFVHLFVYGYMWAFEHGSEHFRGKSAAVCHNTKKRKYMGKQEKTIIRIIKRNIFTHANKNEIFGVRKLITYKRNLCPFRRFHLNTMRENVQWVCNSVAHRCLKWLITCTSSIIISFQFKNTACCYISTPIEISLSLTSNRVGLAHSHRQTWKAK